MIFPGAFVKFTDYAAVVLLLDVGEQRRIRKVRFPAGTNVVSVIQVVASLPLPLLRVQLPWHIREHS